MSTRETIIQTADQYIRHKGFNAFSFKDISSEVGIKTASIHYHFPTKTDLCVATIRTHIDRFEAFKRETEGRPAPDQLQEFLAIYSAIRSENKVCLVGSLATDLNTVDEAIKKELGIFAGKVLEWMTAVLERGRTGKHFVFKGPPRTRALMIITNIIAIIQLSRLTGDADFDAVKAAVLTDLKSK